MTVAIQTKYVGPTNTKPSKIVAWTLDNNPSTGKPNRLAMSYDAADGKHENVAKALLNKLGWSGKYYRGDTTNGYVFVRVFGDSEPNLTV